MAIEYTFSWESSLNDTFDSREFGVVAIVVSTDDRTLTPANIKTAVEVGTNRPLPFLGLPSYIDSRYTCRAVSAPRFKGPRYAEVAINYKLGTGGGEQEEEDPLAVPLRYRVRNGVSGEVTDADVNGNPLVNTAGDPFSSPVGTNISALYIDVVRNEPAYDLQQAITYCNTVNSDRFVLSGYPIRPGEAYCLGIEPEREYKLNDEYVPVVYSFELRPTRVLPGGKRVTQFIHRLLDQGKRGWAYAGQGVGAPELGEIHHKAGDGTNITPVSQDVLLDNGHPLEQDSFVTANPNFEAGGWEDAPKDFTNGAEKDKNPNTDATFLLYPKHLESAFVQLGLS